MARKTIIIALGLVLGVLAGLSFYRSRHLREPVVLGPGVTAVKTLGEYFAGIKGTTNDANVYILEGVKPGGTILVLGGSHPEEPGGRLTTWLLAENARLEQGRLMVINSANRSATTVTSSPWSGAAIQPAHTQKNTAITIFSPRRSGPIAASSRAAKAEASGVRRTSGGFTR